MFLTRPLDLSTFSSFIWIPACVNYKLPRKKKEKILWTSGQDMIYASQREALCVCIFLSISPQKIKAYKLREGNNLKTAAIWLV